MLQLGAGYNPAFLLNDDTAIPPGVRLVEGGYREFRRWTRTCPPENVSFSLHLARSPITELPDRQDKFIARLLRETEDFSPVSIGVHLIGERDSGIGRYGFSSHYQGSTAAEDLAKRFISELGRASGVPVWIENANFYSSDIEEVYESWLSVARIVEDTGAGIILDITHLLIDTWNVGCAPDEVLRLVPWNNVAEMHLSGHIVGQDGTLHDGHSNPVSASVWALTEYILDCRVRDQPTFLTIEHTDPSWAARWSQLLADFERASFLCRRAPIPLPRNSAEPVVARAENYAKGYLRRLLDKAVPGARAACEKRGLDFDKLFERWAITVLAAGCRIVITEDDVLPGEKVVEATKSWQDFLTKELSKC